MSYGDKSRIVSSDSEEIDLNEFIKPLKRNASLIPKPKVFFIQACRSNTEISNNNVNSRSFDHDKRLPSEVGFLFSYSTLNMDPDNGSWYIQMLCKAIREEESKEILHILKYTHLLVSQMIKTYYFIEDETVTLGMMPTYEDLLTKFFYIAKPHTSNEKVSEKKNLHFQIFFKEFSVKRWPLFFGLSMTTNFSI
jgi:hypothetical protein